MNATEVTEVQDRGPAAYIAEFVGTLVLVFFITAVVSLYVTAPSAANPAPFIDFSVIGLVHAFVLFGLIQTLGLISGAHFNPAVTVVMTALRQIKPPDAAIYIIAQLGGAVAGTLLTKLLLEDEGGFINVIVPAWLYKRNRKTVNESPFLLVEGRFERDGAVVNVVGRRFRRLAVRGIAHRSRDFR